MNVHTGEKNAADVTLAESAAQAIRSGEYSLARSILRQAAAVWLLVIFIPLSA